jgi:N-acetyl-gamma-glutamyl-phosphate reductase
VAEVYANAYRDEPFVRFGDGLPSTKNVARTNFCDVTVRVVKSRIVAITAIDNMVKGAAGQAIQNMNLMFVSEETAGLL